MTAAAAVAFVVLVTLGLSVGALLCGLIGTAGPTGKDIAPGTRVLLVLAAVVGFSGLVGFAYTHPPRARTVVVVHEEAPR